MIRHQDYKIEIGDDRNIIISQIQPFNDDDERIGLYVEQVPKFIEDLITVMKEAQDTE
jgi:hypothetical protein